MKTQTKARLAYQQILQDREGSPFSGTLATAIRVAFEVVQESYDINQAPWQVERHAYLSTRADITFLEAHTMNYTVKSLPSSMQGTLMDEFHGLLEGVGNTARFRFGERDTSVNLLRYWMKGFAMQILEMVGDSMDARIGFFLRERTNSAAFARLFMHYTIAELRKATSQCSLWKAFYEAFQEPSTAPTVGVPMRAMEQEVGKAMLKVIKERLSSQPLFSNRF